MARWDAEEVTVLYAIYNRYGLKALDDSNPRCKSFARAIHRTPSAVDRQARNLDDYSRGRGVQHCGELVKSIYNYYRRRRFADLYFEANRARKSRSWRIPRF